MDAGGVIAGRLSPCYQEDHRSPSRLIGSCPPGGHHLSSPRHGDVGALPSLREDDEDGADARPPLAGFPGASRCGPHV